MKSGWNSTWAGWSAQPTGGGVKLLVLSSYQGDTTQAAVGVSGYDGSGNATAMFSAFVSKAELGQSDSSKDVVAHADFSWRQLGIKFNNAEIDQRLMNAPRGPMDAKARAKLMHRVIRRELATDVVQNELSPGKLMGESLSAGFDIAFIHFLLGLSMPGTLRAMAFGRALAAPVIGNLLVENDRKDGPYKYSFAHYFRLDRAAISVSQLALPVVRGRN